MVLFATDLSEQLECPGGLDAFISKKKNALKRKTQH